MGILSLWVFMLLGLIAPLRAYMSFHATKLMMEEKVMYVADAYKQYYAQRCQADVLSCEIKSFNLCQGSDKKQCIEDFPLSDSCIGHGALLADTSGFRYPNSVEVQKLGNQDKQFVCVTALFDEELRNTTAHRNQIFSFTYIGNIGGGFRIYPSSSEMAAYGCRDYDPRVRPWYATGASGGKNVIILMDRSRNMGYGRLQKAVLAVKTIISTLGTHDYFSVVLFDSSTETVVSSRLKKASDQFKQEVRYNMDYIFPTRSGASFQSAFSKAFSLLGSRRRYGARCNNADNIIFLITAGNINRGATGDNLISKIQGKNSGADARIFSIVVGSNSHQYLQSLTCTFKGISFYVSNDVTMQSQIVTILQGYLQYLQKAISTPKPVWTQVYPDSFGYGPMITVVMPIVYEEGAIKKFLGVAAYDLKAEFIIRKGYTESFINKYLSDKSCLSTQSITECEIQDLREEKCEAQVCTPEPTLPLCGSNYSNSFKIDPVDADPDQCCFLSISELVAILMGFAVIVFVIFMIVRWRWKKIKKRERKLQKRRKRREKKLQEKMKLVAKKINEDANNSVRSIRSASRQREEQSEQLSEAKQLILNFETSVVKRTDSKEITLMIKEEDSPE